MKKSNLIDTNVSIQKTYNMHNDTSSKVEVNGFFKNMMSSFSAVVMICAVLLITFYSMNFLPKKDAYPVTNFVSSNTLGAKEIQHKDEVAADKNYIDAFVWTAKLKLEDLQLNHRLQIKVANQSKLEVSGNISQKELPKWQRFLSWYDTKQGFPELKHVVNTTETVGNIPELETVWFDANPTAYFADGSSGNAGSILEDGWEIVNIEAWAVFIKRNGTVITLAF